VSIILASSLGAGEKYGSLEAWKPGSLEAWKPGSLEAWKPGDTAG